MTERVRRVERLIEAVRERHAPDPRISVFEVRVEAAGRALRLFGATTESSAAEALHHAAAALPEWAEVVDRVTRLPDLRAEGPHLALVSSAIAPLLAGPAIAETHVSQAVLGRRLTLLRRLGHWYQGRSEDGYLGWVHRGYLSLLNEREVRAWELGVVGMPYLSLGAEVRNDAGAELVRLPWGARIVLEPEGTARLPDGRRGRISGELVPVRERACRFPRSGPAIVCTAMRWIGAPYLWGGVTHAGVDCSGFVQAVFRLHGIELPRDSDQQAGLGEPVHPDRDFRNLRPGDLLFFAEHGNLIDHVVISAGGPRIVHASLGNGGVATNSLTGRLPYEKELRRLFVCARRYL